MSECVPQVHDYSLSHLVQLMYERQFMLVNSRRAECLQQDDLLAYWSEIFHG